jgi:hypothetical protein
MAIMLFDLTDDPRHLPIPYPPMEHQDSTNHGFMDLRGNPDLIDRVPEAIGMPELQEALRLINAENSRFMSLGCDTWRQEFEHPNHPELTRRRESYIDLAFAELERNTDREAFTALAEAIRADLQPRPELLFVHIIAERQRTSFNTSNGVVGGWSLALWISGAGADERQARHNWAAALRQVCAVLESIPEQVR